MALFERCDGPLPIIETLLRGQRRRFHAKLTIQSEIRLLRTPAAVLVLVQSGEFVLVADAPVNSHSFAAIIPAVADYDSAVMVICISMPSMVMVRPLWPDVYIKLDGPRRSCARKG